MRAAAGGWLRVGPRESIEGKRCRHCAQLAGDLVLPSGTQWSRESILAALLAWQARHGRMPTATDARTDSTLPHTSVLTPYFTSYHEALAALGYERRCRQCQAPIPLRDSEGGRPPVWCSTDCRRSAARASAAARYRVQREGTGLQADDESSFDMSEPRDALT